MKGITDNIIDNGKTGVHVEPSDTKGFAEAIIHLLQNHGELRSMSEAAQAVAAERYSSEGMLEAYESLFAEEDDREHIERRSTPGWITETMGEIIKKGVDRRWLQSRVSEIWK